MASSRRSTWRGKSSTHATYTVYEVAIEDGANGVTLVLYDSPEYADSGFEAKRTAEAMGAAVLDSSGVKKPFPGLGTSNRQC